MFSVYLVILVLTVAVRLTKPWDTGVEDRKEMDFSVEFKVIMTPESASSQGLSSLLNRSTTMLTTHAAQAHFGTIIPKHGIMGNLTHPVDRSDCENFPPAQILLTWFGSCSDADQVEEAQSKGINAIVFITDTLEDIEQFKLPNVTIPAMFMLELDSVLVWDVWAGHSGRVVELRLDTSRYDSRKKEMITFWSCLSVFVVIYFTIIRRYRRRVASEKAYKELLTALPERTVPVTPTDEKDCAVCQEDFARGDKLRMLLPCRHEFHTKCIDAWLKRESPDCPKCRQNIDISNSTYGTI